MTYNNEKYCRLANGEIEPLYIKESPRTFYEEDNKWYLEYRVEYMGKPLLEQRFEIIEFLKQVVINGIVFR